MDNEPALRVLLVENEIELLSSYKVLFSQVFPHWEVVGVTSANAALRELLRFHPNIVMTNLKMPNMNGLELARQIKASPEWRYIYIIMCGYDDELPYRVISYDAGATDYLVKPISPDVLITTFEIACHHILGDYTHG